MRFEADVSGRACLPYFIALDHTTHSVGALIWMLCRTWMSLGQLVRQ